MHRPTCIFTRFWVDCLYTLRRNSTFCYTNILPHDIKALKKSQKIRPNLRTELMGVPLNFTCVGWTFRYFDSKDIANLLLYFSLRQFLTTLWRTSNVINYNNFYNSMYNVVNESFPYKCNIREYFFEFYRVEQFADQHFSKSSIVLK